MHFLDGFKTKKAKPTYAERRLTGRLGATLVCHAANSFRNSRAGLDLCREHNECRVVATNSALPGGYGQERFRLVRGAALLVSDHPNRTADFRRRLTLRKG